ncbi:MAG TPA: Maf family protein [Alphaproteobacteria bacterium]|nr:Maf family protein [Alphaproteobacteria bacterium]
MSQARTFGSTGDEAALGSAAAHGARPVVLASASETRIALLRNAGVAVLADAAAIDEDEIKRGLRKEGASAAEVAETLAGLKATKVSRRHTGAFVIGADQMLECGGAWFDKPVDRDHARAHLSALRGKEHFLISAVAVVHDGALLWRHVDRARLRMRAFSDVFLDEYLREVGEDICRSVGAYRVEGRGLQLFSEIAGDHFTVLGLPLLPLLDFLRNHGVVAK